MPELPEVETVKRGLEKEIINKKIAKTQVNLPSLIKKPEIDEFMTRLKNTMVISIKRRGKYLIILFNTMDYLVVHLGMSGRMLFQPKKTPPSKISKSMEKHNHILFFFEDGSKIIYNDLRKFGKVWLLKKDENLSRIESLGFEPFEPCFTVSEFYRMLQESKVNIKSFLMNQKNIAGIGNIYANEILFHAGVNPLRKANSLTKDEVKRIHLQTKNILLKAISSGGTTMIDESYLDLSGNRGEYGKEIMVYGKKAGICPLCGQPLEVVRIENRSTFLCPNCQK